MLGIFNFFSFSLFNKFSRSSSWELFKLLDKMLLIPKFKFFIPNSSPSLKAATSHLFLSSKFLLNNFILNLIIPLWNISFTIPTQGSGNNLITTISSFK